MTTAVKIKHQEEIIVNIKVSKLHKQCSIYFYRGIYEFFKKIEKGFCLTKAKTSFPQQKKINNNNELMVKK